MAQPPRNMHLKGKSGQKKHYYNGKYRKRKRVLTLDIGEDVLFESKSTEVGKTSLYVGKVTSKAGDNCYIVKSEAEGREYRLTYNDHPVMIKDLTISSTSELLKGDTILVSWKIVTGFVEVVPAQVVEIGPDYLWVKPQCTSSCVKVHRDNVIRTTQENQILHQDLSNFTVSHEEMNIVRLMLHITQNQLDSVTQTYQNTLFHLEAQIHNTSKLQEEKHKLQEMYSQAIKTAEQYRAELMESVNVSQTTATLHRIIAAHKEELDRQEKTIVALDKNIRELRMEFQLQQKEMEELRQENTQLKERINILNQKSQGHYQKRNTSSGAVEMKAVGNKTRPSSFLPISLPNHDKPSSKASRSTLKRRAEQLGQVLNVLSARESPSSADIICTLAEYLRQNPDIAIPACKAAKISFQTELNAKEAVDLKVLLRLPMTRIRDLRRFLSKFNIRLMPSDRHLYHEMSARQYMSEEMVEVGLMDLQKTANTPSVPVAFFRVKSLQEYIISYIEKQFAMQNTWEDANFDKELWIKIGGDKGGSSTKLAFQFVNQKQPNSASSTNILAMFEATDSYVNMNNVFCNIAEQIAELMRQKFVTINGKIYRLRFFYFGDTEFLCKAFGHMGPASSYPCLWCNIELRQLRDPGGIPHCPMKIGPEGKWIPNANWPKKRTIESLQVDIADLIAEEQDESTINRISGRDHHSMARKPIFPLPADVDHIVPPALHILLGLVVRYFKLLEVECRKLDQGDLQGRDEQLFNTWQSKSELAKQAELDLADAQEALEESSDILKGLERAKKGRDSNGVSSDPCCMPLCKLQVSKPTCVSPDDIPWIQCVECGEGETKGWYHAFCVGLSREESESVENDNFICPICSGKVSGVEDVIGEQQDKVAAHKALVKEKKSEYESKKKSLDKTYEEVAKSRGTIEQQLNKKLEDDLKVKRQAYHSQCFVGNHCKLILNGTDVLLDVLPDTAEGRVVKNKFQGLFKRLRAIFHFFGARFLSQDEVKALQIRCWELGVWFPKHFPNETIPPKLHILICHIPEFAERFKTIGLLTEHGIESVHKDINSIERIYCTVRDSQERMRLVIGNHQQRSNTDHAAIEVPAKSKRSCYKEGCKGRYKLSSSKEKTCQKCGHILMIE